MKASVLKRIDALERAVNPVVFPRMTIVDVRDLPDDDREPYWQGGPSVLALPEYPDLPAGTITTLIVSVHPDRRDALGTDAGH